MFANNLNRFCCLSLGEVGLNFDGGLIIIESHPRVTIAPLRAPLGKDVDHKFLKNAGIHF